MYHNPDRIIEEFAYLENKYPSGRLRISIDYPTWYLRFIRMSMRKGDARAARRYLSEAYSMLGPRSLISGLGRWARNKPSQWNSLPRAYAEETSEWMDRYRTDAAGEIKYRAP